MSFVLPESYPDELPEITIDAIAGLEESQVEKLTKLANKTVSCFSRFGLRVAADCLAAATVLQADESKGEVMIWSVSEKVKEWLVENNKAQVGAHDAMMNKLNKEASEEDQKQAEVRTGGLHCMYCCCIVDMPLRCRRSCERLSA
jgi:hypothetical protein